MRPTLENESVLVTGGAGFVGSHLADALVTENDVTVIDDLSNGTRANVPDGATFVRGDFRDEDIVAPHLADVDVVFHQAAQISVERSIAAPVTSHDRNVDATLALLELAREHEFRLVLASSCAIYGHADEVPIPETAPTEPTSPYGLEKLTVDRYAQLYHDHYGVEAVPLRYFNVYGPRGTTGDYAGVIGVFLNQALNGEPLTVHGDGTQTRDFVHVDDVVRANLRAARTDHVGEAFNVGTGTETSIVDLAELVREAAGAESEIVHTDSRDGDIKRSCADLSKAINQLGYEPQVPLEDGLADMITE